MLEQFRELFFSALSLRLRSDVPVGALLSGGLDSSAIVSVIGLLAQEKNTNLDIRTFTATYDEKAIDESGFALDVVRQTGIKNILVYPGSDGKLSTEIEKVIHYQDEPPLTMTAFAHWYLMKEISKHDIKVILSGQGADEMFGGYVEQFAGYFLKDLLFLKKFKTFFAETKLLKSRSGLTSGIILMQLVKAIMSRRIALVFKSLLREKAIQHLNRDFTKKHWGWSDIATGPDLKHSSALNGKLFRAFSSESLPRILHYEDRNSMAFSIEQRMPFLDYRLVEFAFSLANQWKMNSGIGKVILRRALQGVMPDTIVKRFSKLGFTVPQNRWINEMDGYVNQLFSTRSFRQRPYWDADRIIKMYSDNRTKKSGMDIFLWRVIACEVWLNKFFARG
jgi:asparagine synthase (glutamine-hydrolysing)